MVPQTCELGLPPLSAKREHAVKRTYSLKNKLSLGCPHLSSLPAASTVCPPPDFTLGKHCFRAAATFPVSLFACCIEQVKGHLFSSLMSETCFS